VDTTFTIFVQAEAITESHLRAFCYSLCFQVCSESTKPSKSSKRDQRQRMRTP